MIRVRFAPSPTGSMHIGNLRTALYDQLLAMRHGGVFVLRIEDTDQTRLVENGIENILRTLAWANILPDEGPYLDAQGKVQERGNFGPYIQSQRSDLYRQHAQILLEKGHAYHCFCTTGRLEEVKQGQMASKQAMMYDRHCRNLTTTEVENLLKNSTPYVLRLRVPDDGVTEFDDAVRGHVQFSNAVVDDQVLLKSDGFPTYHLANVVDDHLMEITHVIRGEEWLPSTPKHILLYKAFGWEPPIFAHLPLLLNPDRSKLSKRQGDVAVEDYRRQGYLPEAVINFIALLGWNPSDTQELYTKEELAKSFSLEKINLAGAIFNREKLDWINHEYLKKLVPDRLISLALPFFVDKNVFRVENDELISVADGEKFEHDFFKKTLILEQQRVKTFAEFPEATAYFFTNNFVIDKIILPWKKSTPEIARERLQGLCEFLRTQSASLFDDSKQLETATIAFVAAQGWTNAESLWPLRVSLTGRAMSPSPFEVAWALGKEKTLLRIEKAIAILA